MSKSVCLGILREATLTSFKYIRDYYQDIIQLISILSEKKAGVNGLEFQQEGICIDQGKKILTLMMIRH